MNRQEFVSSIVSKKMPQKKSGSAWAPVNIALVKYWGKRDVELNLPTASSLSITLSKGTRTEITPYQGQDRIWLNEKELFEESSFFRRLHRFLDLFRPDPSVGFLVKTENEIPTKAGLASSASGFAATVLSLNDLFDWNLAVCDLSLLARIGSGSACRSIEHGFVFWNKGQRDDGKDSFAQKLPLEWPELQCGVMLVATGEKSIGSKEGMLRTQSTSRLYPVWPRIVEEDIEHIQQAIQEKDFDRFGQIVESNALVMHATMLSAWPPLLYWNEDTVKTIHLVHKARREGIPVFLTMDAGPNVKLLYLTKDRESVLKTFPELLDVS